MNTIKAKESIEALLKQVGLTRTQLAAAMLGVSERAVSDWANRSMEDLTTEKGLRLRRLSQLPRPKGAELAGRDSDKLLC